MPIISTSPKQGLKEKVVSASSGERLFDKRDRYTRLPNVRASVKVNNQASALCDMAGMYVTTGLVDLASEDILDLDNSSSFYGEYAYAVPSDNMFRAVKPGLHRFYVNLVFEAAGLSSVTVHLLKNGSAIGDSVTKFVGFGTDIVNVSGTSHNLLDAGDEVKLLVEFSGVPNIDLKSAADGYAGTVIFVKL